MKYGTAIYRPVACAHVVAIVSPWYMRALGWLWEIFLTALLPAALVGILVGFLAGCTPGLTNDEIIAEVEKCRAAGMDAELLRSLSSRDMVQRVECRP